MRSNNATNAKVIAFIQANESAAQQLSQQTGLSAEFILAWAAYESNYGKGSAASKNNNYFGLTAPAGGTGSWEGAVQCASDAFAGFACFPVEGGSNLLRSGEATFGSQNGRYLNPALEAARAGGGIQDIANAIAKAGFNSEYAKGIYGGHVQAASDAINRRKNCP